MDIDEYPTASGHPLAAVLIPIKAFAQAKVRLAGVLSTGERRRLATRMAAEVIRAAGTLPVHVVCDDEEVAEWARTQGAEVVWAPRLGLNGAVDHGVAVLAAAGISRVIVSHADLPLAADLTSLLDIRPAEPDSHSIDAVTLVPDRRRDGTNVAVVPAAAGFHFSYGQGSFRSHCEEAARLGLRVRVTEPAELTLDIDLPSDLALLPSTWRTALPC
ncbi:MAG: 2-phospho-L-lactate guanylyltransferase [Actinobacteria bacterium]|nr:2-phospho-L-lactate guanylyltransferase [Actinomycetota bacterium]